jgi:hypothetical protein
MMAPRDGHIVTGFGINLGLNEVEEMAFGPCRRCSGKGSVVVDSGTTVAGLAEIECRNKTVICPDCNGSGFCMQRVEPKPNT